MICSEEYVNSIVEEYGNMILKLAYTYLKNMADAEEIVQDVFVKIFEKKPGFESKDHEKFWIVRVTANACKNKLKTFWHKNVGNIDDYTDIGAKDQYDEGSSVLDAVMSLPEKYRAVIHLYYYEEYSTPEIAKILGKSESTIRSIMHRARNMLKDILKEEYDFE